MQKIDTHATERIVFTEEMRENYTILMPNMLPIHFEILETVFKAHGFKAVILQNEGSQIAQEGLKYVHNDTCYPALLVIGQMIDALKSGQYDLAKTAVLMTQTGGGCRASNYIHLLRKALRKAGFGHIPVVSLNASGLEKNPGFTLSPSLLIKALAAVYYGDALMLLRNQVRPYENVAGAADALMHHWTATLGEMLSRGKGAGLSAMRKNLTVIAREFEAIPVTLAPKTRVGVVGEIYMKYASLGNNNLEEFLHSQDCEVMVPGLMGFLFYCADNNVEDIDRYGGSRLRRSVVRLLIRIFKGREKMLIEVIEKTRFIPPNYFYHTKTLVEGVISHGTKMGEGWLLTAEMMELVELGYPNIVCTQPFGCLPNHIVGRGMMNKIKQLHPEANIVAIDYDPGAARVNQENRIKLMLAVAQRETPAEAETPAHSAPQEAAEARDALAAQ